MSYYIRDTIIGHYFDTTSWTSWIEDIGKATPFTTAEAAHEYMRPWTSRGSGHCEVVESVTVLVNIAGEPTIVHEFKNEEAAREFADLVTVPGLGITLHTPAGGYEKVN